MKRLSFLLALLLPPLASVAAPVTPDQARTAVGSWLGRRPGLGCRLGASVDAVRTCSPTNGVRFHVVRLVGGGFVVTSADTRLEPVIAFSDSDDLRESDGNPLWSLLKGDLAARTKALGGAALQSVAPGGATAQPSAEETRWAKLLRGGAALQSATSVSDVRVEPLIQSKWGQGQNSVYSNWGGPCYNYYTPNNYVCGCVATALAQLMRYHRHPSNPKTVATRTCAVDGVQKSFTMMGGPYAYDDMPLVPEAYTGVSWYAGGATASQREAIGRLTYDCGVAMQMNWASDGSGSGGGAAHGPLKDVFGYATAHTATAGMSDASYRERILRTNLDAGYPVMLGVSGPYGGHEILADGYGYSASVLYTHLNMGWSGVNDAWYALPGIDSQTSFNAVDHAIYNVMPDQLGEIVSGRVVSAGGAPVEGATVSLSRDGYVRETKKTDAHGIYAFVAPSPAAGRSVTYRVQASLGSSVSAQQNATVKTTRDSDATLNVGSYSYNPAASAPTCGNVLCDDLVLADLPVVANPVFSPADCSFYPETNVTVTCGTAGATIRYTLDGSDPTEASPVYAGPIRVAATTTVKARAFKDGANPSAVVTAVYTYDVAREAPEGDYFSVPIVIQGETGSRVLDDFGRYGLEGGEPYHTLANNSYSRQYQSAWFTWTAPGDGTASFSTRCSALYTRYPTAVAVYVGDDLASADRLAMSKDYASSGDYSTSVSFSVERGRSYRIVGVSLYDVGTSGAKFTLSWSGTFAEVPTATSTTDVPVPYAWLDGHFPGTRTAAQYETLAQADSDGDGFPNWAEYLCGTDPSMAGDLPRCAIEMVGGRPAVTHNVVVPAAAADLGWSAVLKGSDDLATWADVVDAAGSGKRFFKVVVRRD